MAEKYVNKFHEFKFETDAKKDIEDNLSLTRSLDKERISDQCSNEILLKSREAAEKYSSKE